MAGIGFELRKLYREDGIIPQVKAYAYSSVTTVGPMILCILLVFLQQMMMLSNGSRFLEIELFITTMTYCFICSILLTSGLSMILTRFTADMLFQKKYNQIISSFYGSLIVILPIGGIIAAIFLYGVNESLTYKFVAYLFFMELVVIWIQSVYLSALKDYKRIARSFAVGVLSSLSISYLFIHLTMLPSIISVLIGMDIGFGITVGMTMYHFEQVFPRNEERNYFAFMRYFKKYPSVFWIGFFIYASVYVHHLIYWFFSKESVIVADSFRLMPFYDLPVFYAYLSVVPSLILFVVIVETDFYERFQQYYKNVTDGGTYKSMHTSKEKMQNVLLERIEFLIKVQLLVTAVAIGAGIVCLPMIGFTMEQLDIFILLCLGYFFFIVSFVITHSLMYFDDRKGVLWTCLLFFITNGALSYITMNVGMDGLGMFLSSFLILLFSIARAMYVLNNLYYFTFCSQPLTVDKKKKNPIFSFSKSHVTLSIFITASILLVGCSEETKTIQAKEKEVAFVENTNDNNKLIEDKRLYERDNDSSIQSLYITILPPKEGDQKGLDWYGLNRITDRYSEESLDIIFSEGLEDGAGAKEGMFGHGAVEANAKISLRGNSARYAAQKSYKIKLFDNAGVWQDQRTINLNKHISDLSRIRNKLSFDLLETIPHTTSLRTQFVHLFVKDMSNEDSANYEDYGLYTQVEQPNEMFLKNHWLDPNGQLYKVNFFEFARYPEQIKLQSDPTYDKKQFETILEIKGREEHDKLIAMLEDVNNMSKPIEEVMEEHFDLDNFLTWTAVNILMDNMDTDANNFYLYSPLNSTKWFILPWDYDGAWEEQRDEGTIRPYQAGLSNYWGSILHNRYFRNEKNVQQLTDKLEELSKVINAETVQKQVNEYVDKVKPFILREPDIKYLPEHNTAFDAEVEQLIGTPERALKRYYEDLEKPKPFYMDDVDQTDSELLFSWQISFDLQMDDLFYTVEVARDLAFTDVIIKKENIRENNFKMETPSPGTYYWKVSVKDSKGNEQASFDMYMNEHDTDVFGYGMRQFEVD